MEKNKGPFNPPGHCSVCGGHRIVRQAGVKICKCPRIDPKKKNECCDVPVHLHATSCGWNNVLIIHNGQAITGDDLKKIWEQLKVKS